MRQGPGVQLQVVPLSPWVKKLIIANVAIWFGVQIVLENLFLGQELITGWLSFTPKLFFQHFCFWQPFTYMFFHALNPFHVLMNMIVLWFFGSELEYRWGSRQFLKYYFICGVGAALVYMLGVLVVGFIQGAEPMVYNTPVVGASGAVFGLLLAYGILFGDRVIYFFGVFPLLAKYFVMIIGAVELVTLLTQGMGGTNVANLAHIGGLVTGYLYLVFWTKWQQKRWKGSKSSKARRKLRLVVNNEEKSKSDSDGPKYWN